MTTTSRVVQSSLVKPIEIRPITRQTYRQVALVLSRAFVDDLVTEAMYKNFTADRRIKP
jgi:hypothetical protein